VVKKWKKQKPKITTTNVMVHSTAVNLKGAFEMPYADKEKQKKYCRDYQARQRELLKKLKAQTDGKNLSEVNKP
jgi:hypothetical protein